MCSSMVGSEQSQEQTSTEITFSNVLDTAFRRESNRGFALNVLTSSAAKIELRLYGSMSRVQKQSSHNDLILVSRQQSPPSNKQRALFHSSSQSPSPSQVLFARQTSTLSLASATSMYNEELFYYFRTNSVIIIAYLI